VRTITGNMTALSAIVYLVSKDPGFYGICLIFAIFHMICVLIDEIKEYKV
jgi:hypothetical protein